MLLLEPEITLFISLLPAALSLSLPLLLPHIHFRLSIHCLLSYAFLFHHVSLPPFNSLLLLGSTGVREGLKHQGKNGVILHFDTPRIISPSISLRGEECGTFLLPASPPLTLSPYLPVIMCCRWEGIVAGQIALCLPIPSFFLFIC